MKWKETRREREREGGRGSEREREGERVREKGREREWERKRGEACLLFIYLRL